MKIDMLLEGTTLRGGLPPSPGPMPVEVERIVLDSRRVRPGDLFVALIGERFDARAFAQDAVDRGAVAVLAAGPAPPGFAAPWIECDDPRAVLGPLSARLHGHPDRELLTVGVTGTNGKSTLVALASTMLESSGRPCGRMGTLGYRFRDLSLPGERTTPEAPELFEALSRMKDAGAQSVAMEVSSHALAMGRVDGAFFDIAVFTNLTRDHLDFHADLDDYYAAKHRLFTKLKPWGVAVVCVNGPYGRRLAAELASPITYGDDGRVRARDVEFGVDGTRGILVLPGREVPFETGLLGRFNLENALGAAAIGHALALPVEAIVDSLAAARPLPGRLEPVDAGQDFPVLIDYAHTDAALEAALEAVREVTGREVVVVFGCGGDRDRGKRVPMGRVAGSLADIPVATSDNPRGEDPMQILSAVEEGLRQSGNERYVIEPDRRAAIRLAMELAEGERAVLIAGKGHETEQVTGGVSQRFSDRDEAVAALGGGGA